MNVQQEHIWQANAASHDALSQAHERVCSYIAKPACRAFYRNLVRLILADAGFSARGKKVAEFGCGTGNYAEMFRDLEVAGYTGLDISSGMIEKCRAKSFPSGFQFNNSSIELFFKNAQANGEQFDILFSSSFIHHLYDMDAFFDGVRGVLAPGGVYIGIHEPLLGRISVNRTSRGMILDECAATLAGYDDYARPLRERLPLAFKKLFGLQHPSSGHAGDVNLVDYQFNNRDFSPGYLVARAQAAGLRGAVHLYSYFRFPLIEYILGGDKNQFAFVAQRVEAQGENS
jgi:SAM-dependent methyltransferase